LEIFKNNFTVS